MSRNRFTQIVQSCWRAVGTFLVAAALTSGCSSKSAPTAPTGPATLVVISSPGAVPIMIDGAAPTAYTPATLSLTAGSHAVRFTYLGYRDSTITVSLAAATRETLTVALGPGPGTPRSFGTFQALNGHPDDLAAGPYGPVFVTANAPGGGRALTAYSLDGTVLGESWLGYSGTSGLAVAANGDAYIAQRLSATSFVLNHYTSTASQPIPIYYNGGLWQWSPRAAMGTGDTLLVLCNEPQLAVFGVVRRYIADVLIDEWETGMNVDQIQVDRAARRCYLMGASDTVYVVSTGGQALTRWKAGLLNGNPGKMAIGLDGSLYVADLTTIRHFTGDGAPLGAWGVGGIGGVWGLGVDAQGRIYVAANATQQIVRYVP